MAERRTHPRVSGPFEGSWEGAGTEGGRVVDLSASGCFIESMTPPAPGLVVDVTVAVTGGRLNLRGEVIYAEQNLGFGVRFVELTDGASRLLEAEIVTRLPR